MSEVSLYLDNEIATVDLGKTLGRVIGDFSALVFMRGTLGAGKTTFTRGILNYLGYSGAVKSPTYTLVEPYLLEQKHVFHFDFYRLADPEELEYMGIRDYLDGHAICVIEWPERGSGILPTPDITVELTPEHTGRRVTITAQTPKGEGFMTKLRGA